MKYKILSRESNSEWRALPSGYSAFIRGPRAAVHRLLSLSLPLSLLSDNERCSFAPDPFEIRLLLGRCRRTRNEQWITTPLYRMILSNSERGMMHEDTSSCRWLTSTTPTDPIVRNELRSPDTVRCKRAVHITCSLPDAINDISRTRNEPRSFGKFLSLSLYRLEFLFDFVRVCSDGVSLRGGGGGGLVDRFHERQIESRSVLR